MQAHDTTFGEVPIGMHALAVQGVDGDTKHIWDPSKPPEVEAARLLFNGLRAKGYAAFKVTGKDGLKGEQINEFEPEAARMIFAPPMAGG